MRIKKRYQVIGILSVLSIITYFDRTSISVAGTRITESLHLTETQFGWLQAAFSIAYGLFQIPAGIWGDKKGVHKVLLFIVVWWSAFTFFTGLAQTFAVLLTVRFLFAMGEAGAFPNISISVSKWFPYQERARAQSIIWMCARIGGALAPLIMVPIQKIYGWQMMFHVFGIVGIVWCVVWYFWYRENPSQMPGITAEERDEIEKNRKIKKASIPLSFKKIVSNKNLWALVLMYMFYMFGAYFYLSWLSKYLRQGRGFSEEEMGFFTMMPFILGAIGCFTGGFVSDYLVKKIGLTWGRRVIGFGGLLLAGICMISAAVSADNHVAVVFLSLGLLFKDLTLPVSWTVATEIGGRHAGGISGAMHMFGQIGSTIMTLGFGYIVNETHNWNLPIILIGVMVITSSLLWFLIDAAKPVENYEKETEEEPTPVLAPAVSV